MTTKTEPCRCDIRSILTEELQGRDHTCPPTNPSTEPPAPNAIGSDQLINSIAAKLGATYSTNL